jgi:uncharacterized phage protein (TIGR02220 family)
MKKPFVKLEIDALLRQTARVRDDAERLILFDRITDELAAGVVDENNLEFVNMLISESKGFIEKKKESGRLGGLAKGSKRKQTLALSSTPLPSSSTVALRPKPIVEEVINYLNEKSGKKYKPLSADATKYIPARVNEGYELDDFKSAIDNQCREWLGTNNEFYLRPSTLFNSDKFSGYVNNTRTQTQKKHSWEMGG